MSSKQPSSWRRVALAGIVAGAFSLGAASALAGECAAADRRPDGSGQKPGATAPKDVTDVVLASIDLVEGEGRAEGSAVPDAPPRHQAGRHRALAQPRRPAGADLRRQGRRSPSTPAPAPCRSCTRPAMSPRSAVGTSHWWKNTGTEDVVLVVVGHLPGRGQGQREDDVTARPPGVRERGAARRPRGRRASPVWASARSSHDDHAPTVPRRSMPARPAHGRARCAACARSSSA